MAVRIDEIIWTLLVLESFNRKERLTECETEKVVYSVLGILLFVEVEVQNDETKPRPRSQPFLVV